MAIRAGAHYVTAMLAWIQGDDERAAAAAAAGVILAKRCNFHVGLARLRFTEGLIAWRKPNFGAMTALIQEARDLFEEWPEPVGHGLCLVALGIAARAQGEGLVVSPDPTDPERSVIHYGPPDPAALAQAATLLDTAHTLFEPVGFGWGLATARLYGAGVAKIQGDRGRAVHYLREALNRYHDEDDPWGTGAALSDLAIYAAADGNEERAVRHFGVVAALQERGGTLLPPTEHAGQVAAIAAIRTRLGETPFAALFAQGGAMALDAAVADALTVPTTAPNGRRAAPDPALAPPVELSPRQIDIIQRLADGETAKEMAPAYKLGRSQVHAHIKAIRMLLEVETDPQLVAVAIRRGLI